MPSLCPGLCRRRRYPRRTFLVRETQRRDRERNRTLGRLTVGTTSVYCLSPWPTAEKERHGPAEFLYWHGIREAFARGLDTYDLVNIGPAGLQQFKRGFRPHCVEWHGPRAKIYRPGLARVLSLAERHLRPILRAWARRRACATGSAA